MEANVLKHKILYPLERIKRIDIITKKKHTIHMVFKNDFVLILFTFSKKAPLKKHFKMVVIEMSVTYS